MYISIYKISLYKVGIKSNKRIQRDKRIYAYLENMQQKGRYRAITMGNGYIKGDVLICGY